MHTQPTNLVSKAKITKRLLYIIYTKVVMFLATLEAALNCKKEWENKIREVETADYTYIRCLPASLKKQRTIL